jgi:hypothetical protein
LRAGTPSFPPGDPSEEGEGTVFVTAAQGRSTYWVGTVRDADRVRCARTTAGFAAGTVEVRRRRSDAPLDSVDVTYDLSALARDGAAELDDFAAHYEQDIDAWEVAIETALANDGGP